jgi:hypothetical protein
MSGARVLGGRKGLKVEGHGPILPGHYDEELVAALEVIGPASLASLRQGLRRFSPGQFKFVVLSIVDISPEKLAANPDKFLRGPVEIRLSESDEDALDLDNEFYAFAAIYGDPDEGLPSVKRIENLTAPLVRRHRATAVVEIDDDEDDFGGAYQLGVRIRMPVVGRTVYDAYTLATGVLALIEAAEGAELRRETTLDLLRSQRFDVLLGQHETEWLDFKREGYAKTEHGKLELAKDVASFANAGGGILVLGIATTKAGETETASAVIPCVRGSISAQSYRALIGRRIHPPPERVEIFSISADPHGDVWVVSVPPATRRIQAVPRSRRRCGREGKRCVLLNRGEATRRHRPDESAGGPCAPVRREGGSARVSAMRLGRGRSSRCTSYVEVPVRLVDAANDSPLRSLMSARFHAIQHSAKRVVNYCYRVISTVRRTPEACAARRDGRVLCSAGGVVQGVRTCATF